METDSTQETTPRARLTAIVTRHPELAGARIESIPARTDGGWKDGNDGASHWRISFGPLGLAFVVEYSRGGAYRKWKKNASFMLRDEPRLSPLPRTPSDALARARSSYVRALVMEQSVPVPPDAVDVVSALCMDAECYDGTRDWREFCAEFGYGDDSIRGRDAYYACERAAKYLRRTLGADYDAATEAAREL